ncbi:hypothetical protein HWV62_35364 [Athelia sp. TMB]|nr:hypothetical protein HWV62_35364 [Athelia sp. TMB]
MQVVSTSSMGNAEHSFYGEVKSLLDFYPHYFPIEFHPYFPVKVFTARQSSDALFDPGVEAVGFQIPTNAAIFPLPGASINWTAPVTLVLSFILGFDLASPDSDIMAALDSEPNITTATFMPSPYPNNNFIIQRNVTCVSSPSPVVLVATVLSNIGGIFAFIDGIFSLIFGRTIMAILFGQSTHSFSVYPHAHSSNPFLYHSGSRVVSPFGMLGIVTRNRYKRLIHEQYPAMQEDIENGGRLGMAAYISEVAIDAALVDPPSPVTGHQSTSHDSHAGEGEEGEGISLRRRQAGSSSSYLQLPYELEELDLRSHGHGDVAGSHYV